MSDVEDTLVVVGGAALTGVDAAAVRAAAVRLGAAADALRAAAFRCAAAADGAEGAVWALPGVGEVPPAPDALARRRRLADTAGDLARRLRERAGECERLGDRLLTAAGLYEHAESVVERVAGAVVAVEGFTTGFLAAAVPVVGLVRGGVDAATLGGLAWVAARLGGGSPAETLVRGAAPVTDELVAGAGAGVALGAPGLSGGDVSVTGGARVLSTLVHALLPATQVRLRDPFGPRGPGDAAPPPWAAAPSGTVDEALARTADLYPWGSGLPAGSSAGGGEPGGAGVRPAAGAPQGTLAVERVQHAEGPDSWVVLVPGTQRPWPPDHPFDAVTDVDLMAQEAADVTVAVTAAMERAGVGPDEPVVLVGHSLGGIAATTLAASPAFRARYRVGGVVTAGAPTATFTTPRGVPVLHLENDEELVSNLDGRSSPENPATHDRVTVGRRLAVSPSAADRAASGSVAGAHAMATHLRTLAAARGSGNVPVERVLGRIEPLLQGEGSTTRFFTARRVAAPEPAPDRGPTGRVLPGPLAPRPGPLVPGPGPLPGLGLGLGPLLGPPGRTGTVAPPP
ncbi:hypothetical protein [Puerhibacterium sp. TATVAM-FAB25]|uniref:hypothetical protein n=1 Tax=Puerhibacterium sp. TATVAM-FAB25 TaxID=3093699 RepID=UPI00397E1130